MNKESQPPPLLQALVLADHIHTDTTGKQVIAGTFSRIWCKNFPVFFNAITWAYLLLSDVYTKVDSQLRFVRVKDNSILLQSPLVVQHIIICG